MSSFGKTIYDGENDCFTFRRGETSDEVQGNMGPRTAGDRQRAEKAGVGSRGGLVLGTHGTGRDEGPGIGLHGGPPERRKVRLQLTPG